MNTKSVIVSTLALTIVVSLTRTARPDAVTDWNAIATTAATLPVPVQNSIVQSRTYAMTHAAIHDALNAIEHRYESYAFDAQAVIGASPEAAVAAAAHDALVHQLPTKQAGLDAAYALAQLQNVPQITGFSYISNRFAVSVGWVQGVQFSLHRSPSLGSSTWTRITPLSKSNNFIVTLTDTNVPGAQNFYRVSAPTR